MGFVIKKIVVHSDSTRLKTGEAHYNMPREKWDVRNLLEVSKKQFYSKLRVIFFNFFLCEDRIKPNKVFVNFFSFLLLIFLNRIKLGITLTNQKCVVVTQSFLSIKINGNSL